MTGVRILDGRKPSRGAAKSFSQGRQSLESDPIELQAPAGRHSGVKLARSGMPPLPGLGLRYDFSGGSRHRLKYSAPSGAGPRRIVRQAPHPAGHHRHAGSLDAIDFFGDESPGLFTWLACRARTH